MYVRSGPKILHVNQSDGTGGAARAAYRLHDAMREAGADSTFLVASKSQDDSSVVPALRGPAAKLEAQVTDFVNSRIPFIYPHGRRGNFSPVRLAYGRLDRATLAASDIVILHWLAGAFLKPRQLAQIGKPLVWQLWDLWPFTGGCHYPGACSKYEDACGACPVLGSTSRLDLASLDFRARERAYRDLDLTVVAPSRWIAEKARRSSLFGKRRIEHIGTGVDLDVFRPRDKNVARDFLGLPKDKKILLFGAFAALSNRRKGFHFIAPTLAHLAESGAKDMVLALFGGPRHPPAAVVDTLRLPTIHLGSVVDDVALALIYTAADVIIAPYLEDNLPLIILEGLACGTPVVTFAAGGIPDAVDHQVNGYLTSDNTAEELARGIAWVLANPDSHAALCRAARATAEARFDIRDCVRRYGELVTELAGKAP
jgi:glycosyltransferase involved in cell wall biosynthesis